MGSKLAWTEEQTSIKYLYMFYSVGIFSLNSLCLFIEYFLCKNFVVVVKASFFEPCLCVCACRDAQLCTCLLTNMRTCVWICVYMLWPGVRMNKADKGASGLAGAHLPEECIVCPWCYVMSCHCSELLTALNHTGSVLHSAYTHSCNVFLRWFVCKHVYVHVCMYMHMKGAMLVPYACGGLGP